MDEFLLEAIMLKNFANEHGDVFREVAELPQNVAEAIICTMIQNVAENNNIPAEDLAQDITETIAIANNTFFDN